MSAVHPEPPDKHREQQKRGEEDRTTQSKLLGKMGVGIELPIRLARRVLDHGWMSCLWAVADGSMRRPSHAARVLSICRWERRLNRHPMLVRACATPRAWAVSYATGRCAGASVPGVRVSRPER